jgi:NAD(P)H dehydrogenase (quinone)
MRVLVVYAHPNPDSFCHAVLEQVQSGLQAGGHECEVNDLYEIGFDPVFRMQDAAQFAHESVPRELLEDMNPREAALRIAGGPIRRALAKRWLRGKTLDEIVAMMRRYLPKDVQAQQALVARADGLIFIAPVFWMGLPAILKGWLERVFTYGFAYQLTPHGWQGHLDGRVPMLTQQKGLILTPTFFTRDEYERGWAAAMDTILCDWGLKMAGVERAEHVYFYAVPSVGDEVRREYLQTAYRLAKDF